MLEIKEKKGRTSNTKLKKGGIEMLKMWEQANLYARFVMCMCFMIPAFFVALTCLAEKGDKPEKS